MRIPTDDILVIVDHPHGKLEIPLDQWIATGPGPRDRLRPIAAKSRKTGERLSLRVIPTRYRNTALTRTLIGLGLLSDPWKKP